MKKMVRILAVAMVTVLLSLALVSCGGPSGTYGDKSGLAGVQYTFSGSKVTVTAAVLGFEKSFEGTYKMGKDDEGNKTITFTFESDDASAYSGTLSYGEGKDDNGSFITLGGVSYYKQ